MVTEQEVKKIFIYPDKKKRKWLNYQEVCYKGKILYPGIRNIYERINLIYPEDLKDKSILDFGCNIGMNCQVAIEFGAFQAVGVDYEEHLIDAAKKLNSLYRNNCTFAQIDLSRPLKTPKVDTGFVFAINAHINDDKMLAANIKRNVTQVVYFETHVGKKYKSIPKEINNLFKAVELLGKTDKEKRNFYRCIL